MLSSPIINNESKMPICPISQQPMTEPVMSTIGRSYQKEFLENWIKSKPEEPLARSPLALNDIIPNPSLQLSIQDYQQIQEGKIDLKSIYHRRGEDQIEILTKNLGEIKNAIQLEQQGKPAEFKINEKIFSWPFPLVCPRSCTLITNPVTAQDGTTYEKSMTKNIKHRLLPNLTFKEILPLYKLELDDTLKDQFKKIKTLSKEVQKSIEEFKQIRNKKSARAKKISYLWDGTAILAGIYCFSLFPYLIGSQDILDAHNELAPPADRWNTAYMPPLQPLVTSAFMWNDILFAGPNMLEKSHLDIHRDQCLGFKRRHYKGKLSKDESVKKKSCGETIHLALNQHRYLILKDFFNEANMKHFVVAAENAIKNGNEENLRILYRLAFVKNSAVFMEKIIKKEVNLAKQILNENKIWLDQAIAQENFGMLRVLIRYYPLEEVQTRFVDAAKNSNKNTVIELLNSNLIDRETIKRAMIETHRLKPKSYATYNLLRAHLRNKDGVIVLHRNSFYQPAPNEPTLISKFSERRVKSQ